MTEDVIDFTETISKIVNECNRRGMRPPYTFKFTGPDGTELEVAQSGDLNDISETKPRGGDWLRAAITVTVEDQDGRALAGVIEASIAN